ncbi:hypothetical protein SC206_16725 [Rouxiella sp. T17]|uniref:hypothetical protein n=1 Tax=Rouxiella sp. T17 TaxID=3085684 RepID=UPI002FC618D4
MLSLFVSRGDIPPTLPYIISNNLPADYYLSNNQTSNNHTSNLIRNIESVASASASPSLGQVISTQPKSLPRITENDIPATKQNNSCCHYATKCLPSVKENTLVNTVAHIYHHAYEEVSNKVLSEIAEFLEQLLSEVHEEVLINMAKRLNVTPDVVRELIDDYSAVIRAESAAIRTGSAVISIEQQTHQQASARDALAESLKKCKIENKNLLAEMIRETCSPKSRVALLHAGYGVPFMGVGYARIALQLRLTLPSETIVDSLFGKPNKISPDVFINLETGALAGISSNKLMTGPNKLITKEMPVGFSAGVGVLARNRIGVSLLFEHNKANGHYDYKGLKYTTEQLLRTRINLSATSNDTKIGLQGSDYVTYSSKTTYPQHEWAAFMQNILLSSVGGGITGVGAYFLLPPNIGNAAGAGILGAVAAGYAIGKTPLGGKYNSTSVEMMNAGMSLGILGQQGINGGVAVRASAKNKLLEVKRAVADVENGNRRPADLPANPSVNNKHSPTAVETVLRYRNKLLSAH